MRGLDFLAAGLIALVVIIVASEEILGWFTQKPLGGICTLMVMGVLGYIYFSN